jgi:hypothetical protein
MSFVTSTIRDFNSILKFVVNCVVAAWGAGGHQPPTLSGWGSDRDRPLQTFIQRDIEKFTIKSESDSLSDLFLKNNNLIQLDSDGHEKQIAGGRAVFCRAWSDRFTRILGTNPVTTSTFSKR